MTVRHLPGLLLSLVVLVFAFPGCGAGGLRPDDPTASDATGESCQSVSSFGEPLIADWEAHQRADLEEAMNDGVAVVAYDCHSLRVLRGCKVDGQYGFMSFSKKEEVIRLQSSQEVKVNLPALGSALLRDVGGELGRGTELDLAMVLVGKRRTTLQSAERGALVGGEACAGATHIVKGAFVGAFAMGTSAHGEVSTAAGVFGSGKLASSKVASHRDGDRDACTQVAPDAAAPPSGCAALLRLELRPVVAATTSAPFTAPVDQADAVSATLACPQGFVSSGGKCTRPAPDVLYECHENDVKECTSLCDRGDAPSCEHLADAALAGRGMASNPALAAPIFERNCEAGITAACNQRGYMYAHAIGGPQDGVAAARYYERACAMGDARGCSNLGYLYSEGVGVPRDDARAIALYKRACDGGGPIGCSNIGTLFEEGHGLPKNLGMAVSYYQRGCDGGSGFGCAYLGRWYLNTDKAHAHRLFERACALGEPMGCTFAGLGLKNGVGVAKDLAAGMAYLRRGCDGGHPMGCDKLGALFFDGKEVKQDYAESARLYEKGCKGKAPNSCNDLGIQLRDGLGVPADPAAAARYFGAGCEIEGIEGAAGCGNLGDLYEQGRGVAKDRATAIKYYRLGCKRSETWSCDQLKRLGESR